MEVDVYGEDVYYVGIWVLAGAEQSSNRKPTWADGDK